MKLKKIALREGKNVSELTFELYENYIKVHGAGNPVYTLDNFQDPNFKAVPAFMENIQGNWITYMKSRNDKDLDEIIEQCNKIFIFASAYKNVTLDERSNVWFSTLRDATAKAGL